jgi:hypothetical protein
LFLPLLQVEHFVDFNSWNEDIDVAEEWRKVADTVVVVKVASTRTAKLVYAYYDSIGGAQEDRREGEYPDGGDGPGDVALASTLDNLYANADSAEMAQEAEILPPADDDAAASSADSASTAEGAVDDGYDAIGRRS